MRYILIITLIGIQSCISKPKLFQSKLTVETIYSKYDINRIQQDDGSFKIEKKKIMLVERQLPEISIENRTRDKLDYEIKGNIVSGGLSIHKVKKIIQDKHIANDTLFVKHYTQTIHIAGKEGATVEGYNYRQKESLNIPDSIKTIKIELYENRLNIPSNFKDQKKIRFLAECSINFNQLKHKSKPKES